MPPPLPQGNLVRCDEVDVSTTDIVHLKGAGGCASAYFVAELWRRRGHPSVLIAATHEEAVRVTDEVATFAADARCAYLPCHDSSPYDGTRPDRGVTLARAAVLAQLDSGQVDIVVTTAAGWMRKAPPPEALERGTVRLRLGRDIDMSQVSSVVAAGGYQRTPVVEDPGTFAVRGDILDVWPSNSDAPLRLELEFDHLARAHYYDPETQITKEPLEDEEILVAPAREIIVTGEARRRAAEIMRSLCDSVSLPSKQARGLIEDVQSGHLLLGGSAYLPAFHELVPLADRLGESTIVAFANPTSVLREFQREAERVDEEFRRGQDQEHPQFPPATHYVLQGDLDRSINHHRIVCLHDSVTLGDGKSEGIERIAEGFEDCPHLAIMGNDEVAARLAAHRKSGGRNAGLGPLCDQIRKWLQEPLTVVLTARLDTQADRLATLLQHRGLDPARGLERLEHAETGQVYVTSAELSRGMTAPLQRLAIVTEEEIFGARLHRSRRKARSSLADAIDDLRTLSPGDFVVHVEHGIGRYVGLEHRNVEDRTVELLIVEYQGGDKLMLPVYRLNQIQKFSGDGAPKIDRLGGQTFSRTKSKARKKVREIADQLLKLYAERNAVRRRPIDPPGDDFASFEAAFPYEETPDQAAAILDVIEDLQKETVMDRLVCGDVGFGKTEVALRAAFLTAHAGRQTALLCPTTVLAEQHLRTFSNRLGPTGVAVRGLSRFQTRRRQMETLSGLKSGVVDVVIGTHRLLSKDVHFKNLGLLIVDEEQRFGVTHKERLKEIRRNVDVLTLSATPIPRTLNLAVGGLRDMSVIATAPQQRRSIRTVTSRFDERLIASAIERELQRGGQVYYVFNRVEGIYERAELIKRLVPDARVAVGHGQMTERALEKTMLDFVAGDFDVLCATAIVESGLDIPDANTIIIDRADLFGLAQLYQIRGRVGRSANRAYCYLLVPPEQRLSKEARARIAALERYTELGSGFHIATMDMEIRGAGELLGADQSGFMARVGFELFSQMLEEATAELQGQPYVAEVDPELSIDVEALLPETYIEDIGVRLSLYKRYALATTEDDIFKLDEELRDRFGSMPQAAARFSEVMRLKTHLRRMRALGLSATAKSATLHLRADTPLDATKLVPFISGFAGVYRLAPDGRLTRRGSDEENGLTHADHMIDELSGLLSESN